MCATMEFASTWLVAYTLRGMMIVIRLQARYRVIDSHDVGCSLVFAGAPSTASAAHPTTVLPGKRPCCQVERHYPHPHPHPLPRKPPLDPLDSTQSTSHTSSQPAGASQSRIIIPFDLMYSHMSRPSRSRHISRILRCEFLIFRQKSIGRLG